MRQLIAYPGTDGSFSCGAAHDAFPDADYLPCETFDEAADTVLKGKADYAMLPVENSFAGAVHTTYGLLLKLPLHIVGERKKAVRHQLLGVPGSSLEQIRTIASHPQAIAQCDDFLAGLKDVRIVPSENTAISAREVAKLQDPTFAAIASREAAEVYGLQVLAENIQTAGNNTTRFFVVSRADEPIAKPDKATVIFTVENRVGALVQVLLSFGLSGLNMSSIESRPNPDSPFTYYFVADFEGEMDARHLKYAMDAARPFCWELRLLGVYPRADKTE